ncbi:MAG: helix-turn-helix domain-containing protein [Acidobacteriia bacterium]|nr:helix-turn-helix domain-containing protein [Terriglobia bacterium]
MHLHPFFRGERGGILSWLQKLYGRAERMEPLSVREVAELLGVTPQHVYKMLESNQIPGALRISNHALQFCPRTLLDWLRSKLAS